MSYRYDDLFPKPYRSITVADRLHAQQRSSSEAPAIARAAFGELTHYISEDERAELLERLSRDVVGAFQWALSRSIPRDVRTLVQAAVRFCQRIGYR